MLHEREVQLSELNQDAVKSAVQASDTLVVKEKQQEVARIVPTNTIPKYKRALGTFDGIIQLSDQSFELLSDHELDAMGL